LGKGSKQDFLILLAQDAFSRANAEKIALARPFLPRPFPSATLAWLDAARQETTPAGRANAQKPFAGEIQPSMQSIFWPESPSKGFQNGE